MEEEPQELKRLREKARGRLPFQHQGRTVYEWEQGLDEVSVYIQPPPGVTKHHFDIKIQPHHLTVGVRDNPPYLDADLGGVIETDSSFWMIEDGELHIHMSKVKKGETWVSAFKGQGEVDPFTQQELQKKLMLERFQEEHPGFDFSQASFSGMAPDARTFMGGVKYQ